MKAQFEWYTPEGKSAPVEFVRITTPKTETQPGDEVFREATELDRQRFSQAARAFKAGVQPASKAAPGPAPSPVPATKAPPPAPLETKAEALPEPLPPEPEPVKESSTFFKSKHHK